MTNILVRSCPNQQIARAVRNAVHHQFRIIATIKEDDDGLGHGVRVWATSRITKDFAARVTAFAHGVEVGYQMHAKEVSN